MAGRDGGDSICPIRQPVGVEPVCLPITKSPAARPISLPSGADWPGLGRWAFLI